MSLLAASAIINGGIGVAKGIYGAFQTAKANKGIKNLIANPVTYKRPEEYQVELEARKASLNGELPGMGQIKDNISSAGASAMNSAEKGAISSNSYGRAVGDIYSKQIQAFQDLGVQSAQWRDQQKEKYMSTLEKGANYSDTEWYQNKKSPWDTAMNVATGNKQAGMTNLFGGVEGAANAFSNYAGTDYYKKMLDALSK
jgi:hypothetical protein